MDKIVSLPSPSGSYCKEDEEILNSAVDRALISLDADKVIAVPTDTIYGIAALSQSTAAVDRLYEIKKRHREKAIAICVGSIEEVKKWGNVTITDSALCDLLPGPVTLVFKRSPHLNPDLNPSAGSIGIRIPQHTFIQRLAQRCKQPFALTSANVSDGISTLKIKEFEHLWPQLDLIVDGGTLGNTAQSRAGSTVVDLTVYGEFMVIREGCANDHVVDILQNKYGLRSRLELRTSR